MSTSFLTPEKAARHTELRALMEIGSFVIDDYVEPFEGLLKSSLIEDLIASSLRGIGTYTTELDASTDDNEWRLLLTDRFSLRLSQIPVIPDNQAARRPDGLVPPTARTLATLPNDILLGFKGKGTVRANLYRSAFDRDVDVFTKEHRIEFAERRQFTSGDYAMLRASNHALDIVESDGVALTIGCRSHRDGSVRAA